MHIRQDGFKARLEVARDRLKLGLCELRVGRVAVRLAQVAVGLDFFLQSVVVGRHGLDRFDGLWFLDRRRFLGPGRLGRFEALGEVGGAEYVRLDAAFAGTRLAFGGLAGAERHLRTGGLLGDLLFRLGLWLFQGLGQVRGAERFRAFSAALARARLAFGGQGRSSSMCLS